MVPSTYLPPSHTPPLRAPLPKPVLIRSVIVYPADPYAQITEMLSSLSLMDLLPRFEECMIKDYVLDCENENIKSCLQVRQNKVEYFRNLYFPHCMLVFSYLSLCPMNVAVANDARNSFAELK